MFSGIIEQTATVVAVRSERQNKHFILRADFCRELKIDQSIAHNGVCLTVVDLTEDTYTVTAMKETLLRSNLGALQVGDLINVERSMKPDALLDGHIVQGHVDQTAVCTAVEDAEGSWYFTFRYEPQGDNCTVEKGSVAVNGVSLTVCDSRDDGFRVAIIPYTYEHTNFCRIGVGSVVNLEFENGVTASFTMCAFTWEGSRTVKIMGALGQITGDVEENEIQVVSFATGNKTVYRLNTDAAGHSGGDAGFMRDVVRQMQTDGAYAGRTNIAQSIESHLIALAAEESRVTGKTIWMTRQ